VDVTPRGQTILKERSKEEMEKEQESGLIEKAGKHFQENPRREIGAQHAKKLP
jgi:hypothetical protein